MYMREFCLPGQEDDLGCSLFCYTTTANVMLLSFPFVLWDVWLGVHKCHIVKGHSDKKLQSKTFSLLKFLNLFWLTAKAWGTWARFLFFLFLFCHSVCYYTLKYIFSAKRDIHWDLSIFPLKWLFASIPTYAERADKDDRNEKGIQTSLFLQVRNFKPCGTAHKCTLWDS